MLFVSITQASIVSWTFVGIAILLSIARFYARGISPRGYQWDDLAHAIALSTLLVCVSTAYVAVQLSVSITAFENGELHTRPDYAKFQILLLFWLSMGLATVWAVKFGYLILYRNMFGTYSRGFMKAWWIVLAVTVITFVASIIPFFVYCGPSIKDDLNEAICDSTKADNLQYVYLVVAASLNIATDLAIMVLPLAMLRRMSLGRLQKAGVSIIFSLSFVDIVASALRIAGSRTTVSYEAVNFILSSLESSIAVWISCVPSLHYLFRQQQEQRKKSTSSARTFVEDRPSTSAIRKTQEFSVWSSRARSSLNAPLPPTKNDGHFWQKGGHSDTYVCETSLDRNDRNDAAGSV